MSQKTIEEIKDLVMTSIEDMKGESVNVLNVSQYCSFADYMVFATGRSSRHAKAIAANVAVDAKKAGEAPLGIEGEKEGEWVLVDLGAVVVHIFQSEAREFYALEKLWETPPSEREA